MTQPWGRANAALIEQWTRVRGQLRIEFGDAAFDSWLKPLTLGEVQPHRVRVTVPTRFMRDWIDSNYTARLAELWASEKSSDQIG